MSIKTGLAAVFAAAELDANSKDVVSREALDKAISSALEQGKAIGLADLTASVNTARGDATKATLGRVKAILDHAEAKGREDLAQHLAFETEMSAEAAGAMLSKAPKTTEKTSRLDDKVPNPKLDSSETGPKDGDLNGAVDRLSERMGLKRAV